MKRGNPSKQATKWNSPYMQTLWANWSCHDKIAETLRMSVGKQLSVNTNLENRIPWCPTAQNCTLIFGRQSLSNLNAPACSLRHAFKRMTDVSESACTKDTAGQQFRGPVPLYHRSSSSLPWSADKAANRQSGSWSGSHSTPTCSPATPQSALSLAGIGDEKNHQFVTPYD